MRHDKLQLQLELLLLLTENTRLTVDDITERLGISRRNLYYYLEFFRQTDLDLQKRGGIFYIPRSSKFIKRLTDEVQFTEDEAIAIKQLLDGCGAHSVQLRSVRAKLERFYDFNILENEPLRKHQATMANKLYDAISNQHMVVIKGYSSPHSQTIRDRVVEPFLLINGSTDLRAYEPKSKMNKTFRLARMADVEELADSWSHRKEHRVMYNDLFNFSSETLYSVAIRLDQLSHNVLLEEFPRAEQDVTQEGDSWILRTSVASMLGIGRFVLGLYDHIEIIEGDELKTYISGKLEEFAKLCKERAESVKNV